MKLRLLCLTLVFITFKLAASSPDTWSPYDFGAKADGKTLDTQAIQQAIDSCSAAGGGRVYLNKGVFRSGTLYLKDNVILQIEAGCVLRASDDLNHFPSSPSKYPSYQSTMESNKMLLYAEDAKNIAVIGRGTIDGNGDHWFDGPYGFPSFSKRPRIIHFRACKNVLIRDITLYNSASWVQSYQSCKDLIIDGITVDSRENKDIEKERYADAPGRNTDGLDLIDCERVRVTNCRINSGDDGICLKSLSPGEACRDIVISNCIVSTNASGIKIGTETSGRIEDVNINNCVVYDTRVDALSIMTVDGSQIERIQMSNITCRNIKACAIFIRLGKRLRPYRKNAPINTPLLKDITFENIQGTQISSGYGGLISGLKGIPVENITLKNINLTFEGGGTVEQSLHQVEEKEKGYPKGSGFGILPAYGFYVRHATGLKFDDLRLQTSKQDARPALAFDDVYDLELSGLRAKFSDKNKTLVSLKNIQGGFLQGNYFADLAPNAIHIKGRKTRDINISGNYFRKSNQAVVIDGEVSEGSVILNK